MAVDERRRRDVYRKLEEALGVDAAEALMAHLPPLGWGDVPTKRDVDRALENLKLELRAEIHQVARSQLLAFTTINTFVVALLGGTTIALLKLT